MKMKNILLTAIVIFGLTTISMAQVPNNVPTNGLCGWWPFTGNANDLSVNGNNGTVYGATLTTDRFANLNSAYRFNNVLDYISIPEPSVNLGQPNTAGTISLWFKDNLTTPSFNGVFLHSDGGGYIYGRVEQTPSNGFKIYHRCPSSNNEPLSTSSYNNQIWNNVIIVMDGINGNYNFFLNGILVPSLSFSFPPNLNYYNASRVWQIGSISFDTYHQYKGDLDDIGIWNRALTQLEISALYTGCSATVTTQPINQSVNISNNAQFTTASSDPLATYQWQTDLGVGFQNLNNVGQYSGTINDTLIIANTTLSNNNQPFRCIISSGACTDISAVAVLTVFCNISVITQPINQSVNISNNAQFTTSSSYPLAAYQWQTDLGVGFQNLNNVGQYSGTANDTLTIANTTLSNNNQPFRCIVSSGFSTQVPNYVPTNGLCGWWPFTGNANDLSVNGNNGTVYGATLTTDRFANLNSAYRFNNVLDYISIPEPSVNLGQPNTAGTISLWFKDNLTTPSFNGVFLHSDGGGYIYGRVEQTPSNGFKIYHRCPSSNNEPLSTSSYNNQIWNNVIIVMDGINGNYNFFLNGILVPSLSFSFPPNLNYYNASRVWQIGSISFDTYHQYKGDLDDIGIWNRALTQLEISALYTALTNSVGSCIDTSAVAVLTVVNNVGINEFSQDNLFSVYPNPAQSVINVKADIKLIGKVYSVYDNTGKVVLTGKLNSENTTIELSNLSIGIYMFRVGENMKQTFKVIKE